MAKLRSRYIVQFYGYCLSPKYSIVMEYLPKGSLYSVLRSKEPLDWTLRGRIITEMACGLAVLHSENILHRDIKSLNVLLDEQVHAKLTDFGLSKIKTETRTSTKSAGGTLQWMAPELFKLRPSHTKKSDIYSLGITFWEVAARQIPYAGAADTVVKESVKEGEREEIPFDCPKKVATLIKACWDGDPNKRPEADTIVTFLKSDKEDFAVFLPGFLASKTAVAPSSFTQAVMGNLNSSGGASNSGGSMNNAGSFKQNIVHNLGSNVT
jgi:serine/threonine protein kinase